MSPALKILIVDPRVIPVWRSGLAARKAGSTRVAMVRE
jgi:hypothetical protein